jgi:hypothetical protein
LFAIRATGLPLGQCSRKQQKVSHSANKLGENTDSFVTGRRIKNGRKSAESGYLMQLLKAQLAANPPVWIVGLIDDGGRLAEAGQIVEIARFDRRADFILGNHLNRAISEK